MLPGERGKATISPDPCDTDKLQEPLVQAGHPSIGEEDVIVTNLRHYESLTKALEAIRRVKEGRYRHHP